MASLSWNELSSRAWKRQHHPTHSLARLAPIAPAFYQIINHRPSPIQSNSNQQRKTFFNQHSESWPELACSACLACKPVSQPANGSTAPKNVFSLLLLHFFSISCHLQLELENAHLIIFNIIISIILPNVFQPIQKTRHERAKPANLIKRTSVIQFSPNMHLRDIEWATRCN